MSVALVQNDADTHCYLITYHCTSLFTCEPVWMLILKYSLIHDATRLRGFIVLSENNVRVAFFF